MRLNISFKEKKVLKIIEMNINKQTSGKANDQNLIGTNTFIYLNNRVIFNSFMVSLK